MDPVSAVGLAAGAVQFADVGVSALIGMVKLLKRLKKTPKRMAELLQDVDKSAGRIHALRDAMRQPNPLFTHLSATQLQRVKANVDDAYQAIVDLQHVLEPLFRKGNIAGHGWVKNTWRSVVSVSMEPGIAEKITSIKWLNQEIMSEMQLTSLEMHAQLENTSTQTQRSVEAIGQDVASRLNSLTISNKTIQQVTQDSQSQLTQLQSDLLSVKNNFTDQNTHGRRQIHTSMGAAHTDILSDNRQGRDSIMTAIQHESLQTQAELASLKDVILKFMSGNASSLAVDRSIASRLTGGDDVDLATQVGKQLIRTPSFLKDACDKTTLALEPIESSFFDRPRRLKKNKSKCTCVRKHLVRRIGLLGTAYDFRSSHTKKCPYHQSHWESWSYSLSVRLIPIVQKTVEITFAASFGAGGSSIGPSLRYFGTVERLNSPAFQIFDRFPDRCARRFYLKQYKDFLEERLYQIGIDERAFYFDWDLDVLKTEIPGLCRELSRLLSIEPSSASCADEYGNTILHAIFALIGLLGSHFNHFSDQFKHLARLVIDAGVQVDSTSRKFAIDYESAYTINGFVCVQHPPSTIFDMAVNIAMQYPQRIKCIPLYETIEGFLDDEISEMALYFEVNRMHALLFLRRYPRLLNYYGYGQLEEAIACRSLAQLNHILRKEPLTPSFEKPSYKRLSPVELAIGWPTGLKMLLDVGFDADFGLRLSIYMNDLISAKIILASDNFPRQEDGWTDVLLCLENSKPEVFQVVIKALVRRRQALAELAIKELPEEAIFRLGLLKEKTLDAAALAIYQALQNSGVNIPKILNPATCTSVDCSIYHILFCYFSTSLPSPRLLDSFYMNGFELVDTMDAQEQTPLLLACKKSRRLFWDRNLIPSIRWLLDKGACPKFSRAGSYPNVLFNIANQYAKNIQCGPKHFFEEFKSLIRHSASLCDPLCSDGCQCYCSSAGCLPFYKFWRCDDTSDLHEYCASITSATLFEALNTWLCLCGIDEAQFGICYEEIFRREVFDRLGMAHTCCAHQESSMGEEDRNQLQEEDVELKEQLDLIIQGYQNRHKTHAGGLNDFWKSCMQDLDAIIPELVPQELCRWRCLSYTAYDRYKNSIEYSEKERGWHDLRMKMEKEALAKKGYLGLDFIDVIHRHFADSLDPRPTNPAGNS